MTKIKWTLWVSLFIVRNTAVYVDPFGTEYIPQDVLNKIKHKSINQNIPEIQSDDSIFGFHFIVFIEYIVEGKIWYIIPVYFFLTTLKRMTR